MGESDSKINSYIAGFVQKFLPKHEETIHSGLFLVLSKQKDFNVFDWYFNGYSVISETISVYLRHMCCNKTVEVTDDGFYSITKNQTILSNEELAEATKIIEDSLLDYKSSIEIIRSAEKLFSSA
ncbi:hypothetical protein EU534_00060 [Candidatus Heimdallarchaeota archaeon]|nr:MAG: hypothetical protein EU534_00060 [Candidatus Heimdallarchaeota archaeon]